jgi:hypothetical protein
MRSYCVCNLDESSEGKGFDRIFTRERRAATGE